MKIKRILVGFDGSKQAEAAFNHALKLAAHVRASLTVLSVVQVPEPAEMVETTAMVESFRLRYADSFHGLHLRARKAGVKLKTTLALGHPAEQIIRHAARQHVDMIVLGHRGNSRIKEWLMGSVVKRVLSYAPCSVTVIR